MIGRTRLRLTPSFPPASQVRVVEAFLASAGSVQRYFSLRRRKQGDEPPDTCIALALALALAVAPRLLSPTTYLRIHC